MKKPDETGRKHVEEDARDYDLAGTAGAQSEGRFEPRSSGAQGGHRKCELANEAVWPLGAGAGAQLGTGEWLRHPGAEPCGPGSTTGVPAPSPGARTDEQMGKDTSDVPFPPPLTC